MGNKSNSLAAGDHPKADFFILVVVHINHTKLTHTEECFVSAAVCDVFIAGMV